VAATSAEAGERTLIVDLDPQGNATQSLLGREMDQARPTVGDFFS
jgi:chromosome partitioning protein